MNYIFINRESGKYYVNDELDSNNISDAKIFTYNENYDVSDVEMMATIQTKIRPFYYQITIYEIELKKIRKVKLKKIL